MKFLDALGSEYDLWLLENGIDVVAGAVVLRRNGTPLADPHEYTMYQGVLVAPEVWELPVHRKAAELQEIWGALLPALTSQYERLCLALHHSCADLRGLLWFNYQTPAAGQFRLSLEYTGIIDLSRPAGFDDYLSEIRPNRPRDYRRGLRDGLHIEESTDVGLLDRLHARTFERQGIARPEAHGRLLRAITAAALDGGFGELLVCSLPDGTPISATVFLRDRSSAYYLYGANEPDYRKLNGNTVLMIENIKRYRDSGLRSLDVVGVNSPARGDFKTSFNAVPTPYFVARWTRGSS